MYTEPWSGVLRKLGNSWIINRKPFIHDRVSFVLLRAPILQYRVFYILHCQARSPSIVQTKGKHGRSFETSQANRSLQRCLEGKLIPPNKQRHRHILVVQGNRRPQENGTNPNQETPGIFHKVAVRCGGIDVVMSGREKNSKFQIP